MARFEIHISATAEKTLRKTPKKDISRIVLAIQSLASDPHPPLCRKLSGEESTFRIRVGLYRVIYEVRKKQLIIQVLKIGHRKDIYR